MNTSKEKAFGQIPLTDIIGSAVIHRQINVFTHRHRPRTMTNGMAWVADDRITAQSRAKLSHIGSTNTTTKINRHNNAHNIQEKTKTDTRWQKAEQSDQK